MLKDGGARCPEGLRYLPFQEDGIRLGLECWQRGTGVLFGDEMGLGKTIEAIGLINADEDIRKVLVICPNTLKVNWLREMNKWLVRALRVAIQYPANEWAGSEADVVIVNYDIVHRFEKELKDTAWDLRVLDEAHYVKNHKARRTKFALSIPAKRKAALTVSGELKLAENRRSESGCSSGAFSSTNST
jgi:SWI/SNF-related matrix-associated actin-dependent regulator 1 of chromatin subfamily A